MSLVHAESRKTYAAMRGVSQGASLTLRAVSGGFEARYECAAKAALVLGNRMLDGDRFHLPLEDSYKGMLKLAETFSVALVDTVTDDTGTRFVLVWRIAPRSEDLAVSKEAVSVGQELLPDLLDEY